MLWDHWTDPFSHPTPFLSMLKNAPKDWHSTVENNGNGTGENDADYQVWMGKLFEKCVLVSMLLIWKSLKVQKPPSLPLAAFWSLTPPAAGGAHTRITDLQQEKEYRQIWTL